MSKCVTVIDMNQEYVLQDKFMRQLLLYYRMHRSPFVYIILQASSGREMRKGPKQRASAAPEIYTFYMTLAVTCLATETGDPRATGHTRAAI